MTKRLRLGSKVIGFTKPPAGEMLYVNVYQYDDDGEQFYGAPWSKYENAASVRLIEIESTKTQGCRRVGLLHIKVK